MLVTISDKKLAVDSDNDGLVNYYTADVVTASDYYPFGMQMPGRKFTQANSSYRYGFNGQENSDEIAAGLTTAMYWEYDSRIGRRWNVDPIGKEDESPYMCFSGNPIFFSDLLGNTPQEGGPKPKVQVNLTKKETSGAIALALFAIHANTIAKRNYFSSISTPANKQPLFSQDLFKENPSDVKLFGISKDKASDYAQVYKNYYNHFATIGMWFDGNKVIEELYQAVKLVDPDKQYLFANNFINDWNAGNANWQTLSKTGVTFGNILLMYGGQKLEVGIGVRAPIILAANPQLNLLKIAASRVGGTAAVGKFLGWGGKSIILKSAEQFTKEGLLKAGYTKEILIDIAKGLRQQATKTLKTNGTLNPVSVTRAEQVEKIIKLNF